MTDQLKFIQVGDLCKEITENVLPDSDDLAGKSMQFFFEDGTATRIQFNTIHGLRWEVIEGAAKGEVGNETYRATCPCEGIYFVDYIKQDQQATTVSLVIDTAAQAATAVIGTLPTEAETRKDAFSRVQEDIELTAVRVQMLKAAIDTPFTPQEHPHGPTDELVGKRIHYVYSQTEEYEHIYLNENLYTWHCLKGVEKGLADTDRCHYYKIGDGLYLFVWREKVVPTLGIVVINLDRMKTTGKLFGYEGDDFGQLTNAPIGSFATLLNVTRHVYPTVV
jgi:hypothetical protein